MDELIIREDGKYKTYEELLLRRDQLHKEAASIHVAYVKEFGELLLKDFELKLECIKKRKMIAYCLSRVNRGLAIDVQEMNSRIERELALYNLELKQMAEQKSEADKAKTCPAYKVQKAKRIYRRIAKMIHPDINPAAAADETVRELWERVVIAYHCNDDIELDNLEILVRRALKENGAVASGISVDDLDDRIARLEDEINSILTSEPYVWHELLESPDSIENKKQQLRKAIAESISYSEELSLMLKEIIAEGGVPIAWIED